MTLVRRIARPMLGSIFVIGGIEALKAPKQPAKKAAKVTPAINRLIPQLPEDDETLVRINGITQVVGGATLSAGWLPRISSAALAITLVPTTLAGHRFWEEDDPTTRRNQRLHFCKNVAMLGGLMLAAVDTEGQPGLAWRARHATEELQHSTGRLAGRARREAKVAARAAKQEARLLRAETKARLAA